MKQLKETIIDLIEAFAYLPIGIFRKVFTNYYKN